MFACERIHEVAVSLFMKVEGRETDATQRAVLTVGAAAGPT